MLHLILADSELLLVPRRLWNHPAIVRYARRTGKKPGEILMDSSYHHSASGIGRPDIVHVCLLNALESILNKEGMLRVYVHTIEDKVIRVDPSTRIPRNYNRFVGLIEKLFLEGCVPKDKCLLRIENQSLQGLVGSIKSSNVLVMHEKGEPIKLGDLEKMMDPHREPVVIVGAFPHGDFRSPIHWRKLSVYSKPLMAWTVVNEVITNAELNLWKSFSGKRGTG